MNIYDCLILLPMAVATGVYYWDLFTWKSDLFEPIDIDS